MRGTLLVCTLLLAMHGAEVLAQGPPAPPPGPPPPPVGFSIKVTERATEVAATELGAVGAAAASVNAKLALRIAILEWLHGPATSVTYHPFITIDEGQTPTGMFHCTLERSVTLDWGPPPGGGGPPTN